MRAAGGRGAGPGGRLRSALLTALLLPALAGCAPAAQAGEEELTVLAAASLGAAFEDVARRFEREHPGTSVTVATAGSADLLAQVRDGAPADVLATADGTAMAAAAAGGLLAGDPVPFATNTLVVVTPPGDPGGVSSFPDLARPGTVVVVCAVQVPCGRATARAARAAGVRLTPASEETSVTGVLGKVLAGEADAGVVYVTDAREAGGAVRTVPVGGAVGVVNTYPAAVLAGSRQPAAAREFVGFLRGEEARRILTAAGFGTP